jgi:hypothetical protein
MKNQKNFKEEFGWKFNYPPDRYSCQDASEFLQVKVSEIYAIRRKGEIPFIKNQGMYFFTKPDLIDWLKKNQRERVFTKTPAGGSIFRVLNHYLNLLILFLK